MFDPISLTILVSSIGLKIWSRNKQREAAAQYRLAASGYSSALAIREDAARNMYMNAAALSDLRWSCYRRQLPKIWAIAKRLSQDSEVFGRTSSWFENKTEKQIIEIIISASRVHRPSTGLQSEMTMVTNAVLGLQFLELADNIGLIHGPFADSLNDVVSRIPIEGAGDFAQALGAAGDLSVADALGIVGVVWGGIRVISNLGSASAMIDGAMELQAQTVRVENQAYKMRGISDRGRQLAEHLAKASYDAFKWTWISEHLLLDQKISISKDMNRYITLAFEMTSRQLWASMNAKLLGEYGYASDEAIPQPLVFPGLSGVRS